VSRTTARSAWHGGAATDGGQASILFVGMVAIALTLVMGVVSVTSVQLSRIHLLDAADAAALDASDAIAEEVFYREGLGTGLPLTDQSVRDAASAHLATRSRPSRISSWSIAAGTGSPDGRTAVVRVQGTADIPVLSRVLESLGGGVTITVESRARSDLG
jgi:hypothetical protein